MNSTQNTSILVEAKKEYTKHVSNLLSPIIMEGLQNIYANSKQECEDIKANSQVESRHNRF